LQRYEWDDFATVLVAAGARPPAREVEQVSYFAYKPAGLAPKQFHYRQVTGSGDFI